MKFWAQLKQHIKHSPHAMAIVIWFGIAGWFHFQPPTIEWRLEVYFVATLLFCGWCFESLKKNDTAEFTNEQREHHAKRWVSEVEGAKRDLIQYAKYVSRSGKPAGEWTKEEEAEYWKHAKSGYLEYLMKLTREFRLEDRRAMLRKYWECAGDDQRVIDGYPSFKEMRNAK